MTKRSGARARHEAKQADLFGAALLPAPKKARSAKALPTTGPALRTERRNQPPPDALLNVRQAAARLGLSKSTLDKMRGAGKGPRFVKSTDRAVRYDPVDLDAWIEARRSGHASHH
jgi:predicted DNA-binding transcriptional regulator AlpA